MGSLRDEATPRVKRLLLVALGERRFQIPFADIRQLLRWEGLDDAQLLEAPALGCVQWRGEVVVVFDLADLLGVESSVPMEERLLLVSEGLPIPIAFLVDRAENILNAGEAEVGSSGEALRLAAVLGEETLAHLVSWHRMMRHLDHIAATGECG